jgi:hypothetical protein
MAYCGNNPPYADVLASPTFTPNVTIATKLKRLEEDRPMAVPFPNHPNLTGGYAPIQMECSALNLVIVLIPLYLHK